MTLLFFEVFAFKIDTFLHTLDQFSKHFFHSKAVTSEISVRNVSTAASGDSNRSSRILFLMFEKKKSLGDKSGEYGQWVINSTLLLAKKSTVWRAVWQLALSWWRMMWRFRFVIRNLFMTSGKQIVVYQSIFTVLRSSEATVVTSGITEETSNHLLGSTAWTNNFCWFRFILKYLNSGLLFIIGLIRIDPCFVPNNDVVDQIWPTSIEFLEHFFAPFNTSLFLSFGQIVWDPTIAFSYAQVII